MNDAELLNELTDEEIEFVKFACNSTGRADYCTVVYKDGTIGTIARLSRGWTWVDAAATDAATATGMYDG